MKLENTLEYLETLYFQISFIIQQNVLKLALHLGTYHNLLLG
jgi:hypothetical protein